MAKHNLIVSPDELTRIASGEQRTLRVAADRRIKRGDELRLHADERVVRGLAARDAAKVPWLFNTAEVDIRREAEVSA